MSKFTFLLTLGLLFLFGSSATAQTDISLIEINQIGADKLNQIKNHEKVDWWVEMGDKMVVSFNDSKTPLPVFTRILATQKNVNVSDLAFKSTGHWFQRQQSPISQIYFHMMKSQPLIKTKYWFINSKIAT